MIVKLNNFFKKGLPCGLQETHSNYKDLRILKGWKNIYSANSKQKSQNDFVNIKKWVSEQRI